MKFMRDGKTVGIAVSGGNVDAPLFARTLSKTMAFDGCLGRRRALSACKRRPAPSAYQRTRTPSDPCTELLTFVSPPAL